VNERQLPAYWPTAIDDPVIWPALLYEGEFLTQSGSVQYLRLWSGVGPLSWNGATWQGGGTLLGITPIEEAADLKAVGFSVSMSGQNSSIVAIALNTAQLSQGRPGKVWLALFNEQGQMLDQPQLLKRGKLDICVTEDAGDGATTVIAQYEDRLIDLRRARIRHYTDQDQKRDYPSDRGFEFVAALQDMQIPWGRR
jgi:hypothetical protein